LSDDWAGAAGRLWSGSPAVGDFVGPRGGGGSGGASGGDAARIVSGGVVAGRVSVGGARRAVCKGQVAGVRMSDPQHFGWPGFTERFAPGGLQQDERCWQNTTISPRNEKSSGSDRGLRIRNQ
jgi:hypothetical protein